MVGGLFGDLPPPSKAEEAKAEAAAQAKASIANWSASKLAPSALRKPSPFTTPPPSVLRNQAGGGSATKSKPPFNPSRLSAAVASLTARNVDSGASPSTSVPNDHVSIAPPSFQPVLVGANALVTEEYDPARPNDYEDILRERRKRKMEDDLRREMERKRQEEEERVRDRERELQRARDMEQQREEREGDIAAPRLQLNISGEEAFRRRAMLSGGRGAPSDAGVDSPDRLRRSPSPPKGESGFSLGKAAGGGLGIGAGGQMTAAERMMAKMGWKAGQGLGKQEQGITTPLMARKTDKRAGVIVNAAPIEKPQAPAPAPAPASAPLPPPPSPPPFTIPQAGGEKPPNRGVSFNGPPTRVVLLRNMVGPGEVDDELEDEVAGECLKYGTVTRVLIFEITEEGFSPAEAVRIFIQFDRSESATKALVDLDGRFFGGRTVRATFFSEDKFDRNELAPVPGEPPAG
eukprot:jgi/Mesen1/4342/ME000022S03631